ncbi:fungal-specific transcription factor domain-containing protein [Scleroderma yunnanense]
MLRYLSRRDTGSYQREQVRLIHTASCVHAPVGHLTLALRVLMAHAQRLTEQVKSMTEKIKQLEQALEEAQTCSDPSKLHPLPRQSSRLVSDDPPDIHTLFDEDGQMREAIEAMGSLSIGLHGQVKYHGESAGSEYFQQLLMPDDNSRPGLTDLKNLGLPSEIIQLCNAYPFGLRENPYTKYPFLQFIPSRARALYLAELYYENMAWMYNPISRNDFMSGIIDPLYGHLGFANLDRVHSHTLSVFFILLASGTLYDSETSAILERGRYYALARAALCIDSMLNEATCSTVQAIFMTIRFIYHSDRSSNEGRWLLTGLCVRAAQIIGLQRDSAGWNLGPEEVRRRRVLFWELFTFDAWTSIVNGRPPALNVNHTDCKFPEDTDVLTTPSGNVEMGWHNWKFRYSASCLSVSVNHVFNMRPPGYSAVLELDRKICKFVVPPHLQCPMEASEVGRVWSHESTKAMQQYSALCVRESNLLYIHRSYFAQAINEAPENPLQHKYSSSVFAAYRSACRLIFSLKGLCAVHPGASSRQWFFWSSVFSSCVVLGALVAKSPCCTLSPNAMKEFDQAMSLYEQGSEPCRPPTTLPVLQKLRQRAISALTTAQIGSSLSPPRHSHSPVPDELDVLKGRKGIITCSPSNSPASSGSYTFKNLSEDFADQFASTSQPSHINYYTPPFDHDAPASSTYFASASSSRDSLGGGFSFFDPTVQNTAPSMSQPGQFIVHSASAGPSAPQQVPISARHPQQRRLQSHQQFQQQQYASHVASGPPAPQPQNREEVWRQFVYNLDVNWGS